ncbi:AAA-like domain-containing protein [Clostridium manihotivorum]|uniref:AAA family ATPase n=1 Tax=Clostridium manihotivorum TaxID=2320868 RepID=A0A3R5X3E8_9CLOT|nr:AAA-like domain-containing protein [Clostridium manihotivorum]QAA33515.1 AAA family ATPase [Clostridium manihotivorum]
MKKKFNVTGTCIPKMHYMVDTSKKIDEIMEFIEDGEYFIINRPRQYGKTTTLFLLENRLNQDQDYLVISISFEGVGDLIFQDEMKFSKAFLKIVKRAIEFNDEKFTDFMENENPENLDDISTFITKLVKKANKKIILMIDEVDKSSNNQLFLSFLGMLRNKYLLRNTGKDYTFHSVILAGVHDVKTLKIKIRSDEEHKYNSPWNIAADFDVDMSFSSEEIKTMLDDYVDIKGVSLNKEYFSDRLYYYTSGYPFLVSKLCKIIDEKIMESDNLTWDNEYMDLAVKEILRESNTNFDSLIKNIENNADLKELVKRIILDNDDITYVTDNPIINLGIIYGIFKNENGKVKINNKIYEQRIYNYMSSLVETSIKIGVYNQRSAYIKEDNSLDIRKILIKFSEFMKHERSEKRETFLEADGRLLFLAFISPIINGTGFAFKEVQGGEEKRFDIVLTYNKKMYIIELKLWRGEEYHSKGLTQLGEYLEQYSLNEGYLLVFDFRKEQSKKGDIEEVTVASKDSVKRIIEVYC